MNVPAYWSEFPEIIEKGEVRCTALMAGDGVPLHCMEIGTPARECFLLVMPTTTPFLLMVRSAVLLSRYKPVLSWELRGSSFLSDGVEPSSADLDRHVQDALELLVSKDVERVHIVAWCSGVDIATQIVARAGLEVRSVVLIAPTLVGQPRAGKSDPPFRQLFVPMLSALAYADEKQADSICRTIIKFANMRVARDGTGMLLNRLTGLNLTGPERIKRYATLTQTFYDTPDPQERLRLLRNMCEGIETLMLCFEDDEMVSFAWAKDLAAEPNRLILEVHESGGHFAPFLRPELVCEAIMRFQERIAAR